MVHVRKYTSPMDAMGIFFSNVRRQNAQKIDPVATTWFAFEPGVANGGRVWWCTVAHGFQQLSNAKCCFFSQQKIFRSWKYPWKKGALSEILLMEEIRLTSWYG